MAIESAVMVDLCPLWPIARTLPTKCFWSDVGAQGSPMRRLSLLPHGPYLPTASELHRARECLAVWAYGLPESEDAPGEWAEDGQRKHRISEALSKNEMVLDASAEPWAIHVHDMILCDRAAAKLSNGAHHVKWWFVERGIKWRSDGFADEAKQCERTPGERLQGWFSGTADLVYVRTDGVLVVADWKFGPRAKYIDAKAKNHAQGWFLALAFTTLLEITGSSDGVVVARFEARYVGADGIDVDGIDITWGEICEWRDVLAGLAKRIETQENALPRITVACNRCKAKAACPAQMALETSVMAEVQSANIEALCRPPQSAEDVRALHHAIAQAEHLAAEWKKWRDSYVLTVGPVLLGMGLQLEAKPQSKRSVVATSEAMDLIESVAGKAAIEVQRSATCDSIKKAAREGAPIPAGVVSTTEKNKAKAKAEADAFAALIAAGAVRESGKTYTVRECRAGETEE